MATFLLPFLTNVRSRGPLTGITRQQQFLIGLSLSFFVLASRTADAAYITIDSGGIPVGFVHMTFWNLSHTAKLGELWSSDRVERPADAFPLGITMANPLMPGHTYMSPLIPWLPDSGFRFGGLNVFSDLGLGRLFADPHLTPGGIEEHTVIIPGDFDCRPSAPRPGADVPCSAAMNGVWPLPGCNLQSCGFTGVLRIALHSGAPPFNFSGYYPASNDVNAGAPVAVRVYLRPTGDDGRSTEAGFDILKSGFPASQVVACTLDADPFGVAPTEESVPETVTASDGVLSYEGNDYYTYVWQTREYWAKSCLQLNFKLADDSVKVENFRFK